MKVLKASPNAKTIHIPQVSGELLQVDRMPLCMPDADTEFGILQEGLPTCENCIRKAVEMIQEVHGDMMNSPREEYKDLKIQLDRLYARFHGVERLYLELGGQNVRQPVRN